MSVEQVLQAVRVALHEVPADESTRRQALQFLQHLRSNASQLLEFGATLAQRSYGDGVRISALRMLSDVCKCSPDASVSSRLHETVLRIACEVSDAEQQQQESRALTERAAAVVVDVMKYQWPHQWPDLLPQVLSLANRHAAGVLMALRILREAVKEPDVALDIGEVRRSQLHRALGDQSPLVLSFLCQLLAQHEQMPAKMLEEALQCTARWLKNAPLFVLFKSGLIEAFCAVAKPQTLTAILPCFESFFGRHIKDIVDHATQESVDPRPQYLGAMHCLLQLLRSTLLPHMDIALSGQSVPQQASAMSNFDDNDIRIAAQTLSDLVLSNGLKYLADDAAVPLRAPVFGALLAMIDTHKFAPSQRAATALCQALKEDNAKLLDDAAEDTLATAAVQVMSRRACKRRFDEDEFDDREQMDKDFGAYRAACFPLIRECANRAPLASLRAVHALLTRVFSAPIDEANPLGFATLKSECYRQCENAVCILKNALLGVDLALKDSKLQAELKASDAATRGKVPFLDSARERRLDEATQVALVTQMRKTLHFLLGINTEDALIEGRRLHALSLFTTLFQVNGEDCASAVSALLQKCGWTPAAYKRLSQMPQDNKQVQSCHCDLSQARRRACYSLVGIGKHSGEAVLRSCFAQALRQVELLLDSPMSEQNKALLLEFCVSVANAMREPAQQAQFVQQVLAQPTQNWQAMQALLQDDNAVVRLIEDDALQAQRAKIRGCLSTFVAVFRAQARFMQQTRYASESAPGWSLMQQCLPHAVTLLVRLQRLSIARRHTTCLAFETPSQQMWQAMRPDQCRPEAPSAAYARFLWFASFREQLYSLVGLAGRCGAAFFEQDAGALLQAVLSAEWLREMPLHWVRVLLEKCVVELLRDAPVRRSARTREVTQQVLRQVLATLLPRLHEEWRRGDDDDVAHVQTQIFRQRHLREVSRELSTLLVLLCVPPDKKGAVVANPELHRGAHAHMSTRARTTHKLKKRNGMLSSSSNSSSIDTSEGGQETEVGAAAEVLTQLCLLSEEQMTRHVCQAVALFLTWDDTLTRRRGATLALRFVETVSANPDQLRLFAPFLLEWQKAAQTSLFPWPKDAQSAGDLVTVVQLVYMAITGRLCSSEARNLLLQAPQVTPAAVAELEQTVLSKQQAERAYRAGFKRLLQSAATRAAQQSATAF